MQDARFELSVEKDLRAQLQARNEQLLQLARSLREALARSGIAPALPHADEALVRLANLHADARADAHGAQQLEARLRAAAAEAVQLRADAARLGAQLASSNAELDAARAQVAELRAALARTAAPTLRTPNAPVPAAGAGSGGEIVTPQSASGGDARQRLATPREPAQQQPAQPVALPAERAGGERRPPLDAEAEPPELPELISRVCATIALSADGKISERELGAFLAAVDSLQPLGHDPHAKAAALCRDFGDGVSIPLADFQTILAKLARGNPARLLELAGAWAHLRDGADSAVDDSTMRSWARGDELAQAAATEASTERRTVLASVRH